MYTERVCLRFSFLFTFFSGCLGRIFDRVVDNVVGVVWWKCGVEKKCGGKKLRKR